VRIEAAAGLRSVGDTAWSCLKPAGAPTGALAARGFLQMPVQAPGRRLPHHVLAQPHHPPAPLASRFAPWRCGNHRFGPGERGSGAETSRSVTSAASARLPSQPRELPFSSAFPPVCSHAAPAHQGPPCPAPSSQRGQGRLPPGVPFPAAAPSGLQPARLPFLLAQRVPALAGAGERSLLAPGSRAGRRTWPRAPTGSGVCYSQLSPVLRDRSCVEGRSCRSGLG